MAANQPKEKTSQSAKPEGNKCNTILHVCGRSASVVAGEVVNKTAIERHVAEITAKAQSNADAAFKKQLAQKNAEIAKLQAELEAAKNK